MVLCIFPVLGLEISQSLVGEGHWSTSMGMGTTSTEMSGQGDMSYASQGSITDAGVILKSGLEFDGSKGRVKLQSNLGGNNIIFSTSARNANHISLRTKIDTASSEETQDSTIGSLSLHSASINGQINGSIGEEILSGLHMGRPVDVSKLEGIGNFTINSTVNLNEYQSGATNE